MIKLICRKTFKGEMETKKMNIANFKFLRENLIIAAGLSVLFGLGWGFGLTATSSDVEELTFAFQVLFSLFVGSQGVLIFVFHGIRSQQFRQVWVSLFGLRGTVSKYYALSSNHPPKNSKQAGPSSSATYNMATLTMTGTLPSDSSSKNQKKELQPHSSDYSQGFSSVELESAVFYFEKSTVIANEMETEGDHECNMDTGENHESGTERNEEYETKKEGNREQESEMEENHKGEVDGDRNHGTEMKGGQECKKEIGGYRKRGKEMDGNSNQECEEGNFEDETTMGKNLKHEAKKKGNSQSEGERKVNQKCETETEDKHA